MNKLSEILNKVSRIIENSEKDTKKEIYNISNVLEIDEKTATVLHFINKDSYWNPNTLHMLEDIMGKLPIKEQKINQSPEKRKEIKDFYLLNYLDRYWKDTLIKRLKEGKELNFIHIWVRKEIGEMVADIKKLGLYPTRDKDNDDDFEINPYFTHLYKPVLEWLKGVINSADAPLFKGFDYTTEEGDYED